MAKMLLSRFSAERCINLAWRHQRLCKRVVNDAKIASQIKPAISLCKTKMELLTKKKEGREIAYDDLVLSNNALDDEIRSVYENCNQYIRNHPADLLVNQIFPDGKFGDLVRLPFEQEIIEAEKMVLRLLSLGEEHQLHSWVEKLNYKISEGKKAIKAESTANKAEKNAKTEVNIAKDKLIRQYEHNYLDARKKYGNFTANKLFPRPQTGKQNTKGDEPDDKAT